MKNLIIPAVAVIAAAPVSAQAQVDPSQMTKENLLTQLRGYYNVLGGDDYATPVQDEFMDQYSQLRNEIDTKYEEALAATFWKKIEDFKDAAAARNQEYIAAKTAAEEAIKNLNAANDAAKTAIEALEVPAVEAEWLETLANTYKTPATPDINDIEGNKTIKAEAEALTAAINKVAADAAAANKAEIEAQAAAAAQLAADYDVVKAATDAADKIAALAAKTNDATMAANTSANDELNTKAVAWVNELNDTQTAFTLDAKAQEAIAAKGAALLADIAANLEAANNAAAEAEAAEYADVTAQIEALNEAWAAAGYTEEDTQSASANEAVKNAIAAATEAAKGFNEAGTSVANKETNAANIADAQAAIETLKTTVASYAGKLSVDKAIAEIQDAYRNQVADLNKTLAGEDLYGDLYDDANLKLAEVAKLVKELTTENEALYAAVSTPAEYEALLTKINNGDAAATIATATAAVELALNTYKAQEAAKKAADEAIAAAKTGAAANEKALADIAEVEKAIADEYAKHELAADDYESQLANIATYLEQLKLVTADKYTEIKADDDIFSVTIAKIEAGKTAATEMVGYDVTTNELKSTDEAINAQVSKVNTAITDLNAAAVAEAEALANIKADVKTLNEYAAAADAKVKDNYGFAYDEAKAELDKKVAEINGYETAAEAAYKAEPEAEKNNAAVREISIDVDAIEAAIDQIVKDANAKHDARVHEANAKSLAQLNSHIAEIEGKLAEAQTTLAQYKDNADNEIYSEVLDGCASAIAEQKALVADAEAKEKEYLAGDHENEVHPDELFSLLAKVDEVLYGNDLVRGGEEIGIWENIETIVANAAARQALYNELEAAIDDAKAELATAAETILSYKYEDETAIYQKSYDALLKDIQDEYDKLAKARNNEAENFKNDTDNATINAFVNDGKAKATANTAAANALKDLVVERQGLFAQRYAEIADIQAQFDEQTAKLLEDYYIEELEGPNYVEKGWASTLSSTKSLLDTWYEKEGEYVFSGSSLDLKKLTVNAPSRIKTAKGILDKVAKAFETAEKERAAYIDAEPVIDEIKAIYTKAVETLEGIKVTEEELAGYLAEAAEINTNEIEPLAADRDDYYAKKKMAQSFLSSLTNAKTGVKVTVKAELDDIIRKATNNANYNAMLAEIEQAWAQAIDLQLTLTGEYLEFEGYEDYADYKEDLETALGKYTREQLGGDIKNLTLLKENVEAMDKTSDECSDPNLSYKTEIDAIADDVNTINDRAIANRNAFIASIDNYDALVTLQENSVEKIKEQMLFVEKNGATSEELEAAIEKLENFKNKEIADFKAGIVADHNNLEAAAKAYDNGVKFDELQKSLVEIVDNALNGLYAEILAQNNKNYNAAKAVADEANAKGLEYAKAMKNYVDPDQIDRDQFDYTEAKEATNAKITELRNQINIIMRDAKDKKATADTEFEYFDMSLSYKEQIKPLLAQIDEAYNEFVAAAEADAEALYHSTYDNVVAELDADMQDVKDNYAKSKDALKKFATVESQIEAVNAKHEAALEDGKLSFEVASLLEELAGIDIQAAYTEAAHKEYTATYQTNAKAAIANAKTLKYNGKAYAPEAQAKIDAAIEKAEAALAKANADEKVAKTNKTLPAELAEIVKDITKDILIEQFNAAQAEADAIQEQINTEAANNANFAALQTSITELQTKYDNTVAAIESYEQDVLPYVQDELDAIAESIAALNDKLDTDKNAQIWLDENFDEKLAEYNTKIDGINNALNEVKEHAEYINALMNSGDSAVIVLALNQQVKDLINELPYAEVNLGGEYNTISETLLDYQIEFQAALEKFDPTDVMPDDSEITRIAADETYVQTVTEIAEKIEAANEARRIYEELKAQLDAMQTPDAVLEAALEEVGDITGFDDELMEAKAAADEAAAAAAESLEYNRVDLDIKGVKAIVENAFKDYTDALEAIPAEAKKAAEAKAADEAAKQAAAIAAAKKEATTQLNTKAFDATLLLSQTETNLSTTCPDVAGQFVQREKELSNAISQAKTQLKEQIDALNSNDNSAVLTSIETEFAAIADAIATLKADAEKAQTEFNNGNAAALAEVQAAKKDMQKTLANATATIDNIIVEEIADEYADKLDAINTTVSTVGVTSANKDEKLAQVADIKAQIEAVQAEADAAYQKWLNKGNFDGNDKVNVTDYSILVDYVTGAAKADADQAYAADVNLDGDINVADLTNLANIILGKTTLIDIYEQNHAKKARALYDNAEAFASLNGKTLDIALSNDFDVVALQADIVLPSGMTLAAAETALRAQGLKLYSNTLSNGTVRVVLASMDNKAISGNEGDIISLKLEGVGAGDIELTNVIASDAYGRSISLAGSFASEPTAIAKVAADLEGASFYTVDGAKVDKLQKGINIVVKANGEKTKVLVK